MVWLHPALSTQRLEDIRFWALRAAEQSREYGESEEVWGPYADAADRASDLLAIRQDCFRLFRNAECASIRLRASERDRANRNGCFHPLCLLSARQIQPGRVQFHHKAEE